MRPAGPSFSIPTKLLATGVACALAILVCGTAAAVVVASDVTSRLKRGEPFDSGNGTIPGGAGAKAPLPLTAAPGPNATLGDLAAAESRAGSHAAEEFAGDRTNHPALRVAALSAIVAGGCRNVPELVLGFSEKRRVAMRRAVEGLRDIEGGVERGERHKRLLDSAFTLTAPGSESLSRTILGRSTLLGGFSWIVPPGVRARAAWCASRDF